LATNGSRVDTSTLGFGAAFGVPPTACCSGFVVAQGAQLTATTAQDLIRLESSVFNSGPDAFSGGHVFFVGDTFNGAPASEIVARATVTIAGRLLSADSSSVTGLFSLLSVVRSNFTSTTTNPLIAAVNSDLKFGGLDPTQTSSPTTIGRLLQVIASSLPNTVAA